MRSRNTLRQSGGAVTKLNTRMKNVIKMVVIAAISLMVFYLVIYYVDNVFNGMVGDWFSKNYVYTSEQTLPLTGERVIVERIDWVQIKKLLLLLGTLAVVLLAMIVFFVSIYIEKKSKKQEKQMIEKVNLGIRAILSGKSDEQDAFPEGYHIIAEQIAQMRATMTEHERMLQEEAKQKNDLITYLAHDLKTPLTSVIGYLSLLDEAADMPEKQRIKYVHITLEKALRLEQLINEFFDITRYNLHQMLLEKETIDLYYMLVQMTDEFYPALQAHGNEAVLQADENLTVYGDPDKLARVFHNILKNAIAYSYPNTLIEIEAKRIKRCVYISFRNSGKTISKQKLNVIFDKYFRLDESRSANSGGAGLGLAIAKEIVTLHGGDITASSENEETVFSVSLPDL